MIRPVIINYDLEEISKFLRQNLNQLHYSKILMRKSQARVTKTELKRLEEQFYLEQTRYKLEVLENSPALKSDRGQKCC